MPEAQVSYTPAAMPGLGFPAFGTSSAHAVIEAHTTIVCTQLEQALFYGAEAGL